MRYLKFVISSLFIYSIAIAFSVALANPQRSLIASSSTCNNLNNNLLRDGNPVIKFSHKGYLININSEGRVTIIYPDPANRLVAAELIEPGKPISPLTLKALLVLAEAEGFWNLPGGDTKNPISHISPVLPGDKDFIMIRLACASRVVAYKAGTEPSQFNQIYSLLVDLFQVPHAAGN